MQMQLPLSLFLSFERAAQLALLLGDTRTIYKWHLLATAQTLARHVLR